MSDIDARSAPEPDGRSHQLAVLGFHKIGPPPGGAFDTWFYIPARVFEAQLRWIHEAGWHVISAQQFLDGLVRPEALPGRAVLLTFDDGYRSLREVAVPMLRVAGFPAVMFMATSFIGGTNAFDAGIEPDEPMCNWNDIDALRRCDVSIQSHGVSHRRFSTLEAAALERELAESKAVLEAGLGEPVELFSYPYGDAGSNGGTSVDALRRTGYKAGFLFGGGTTTVPLTAVDRIDRIAMGADTDLAAVLPHRNARSAGS